MHKDVPCCDLNSDASHPYRTDPPHRWRDPYFGFVYKLCDVHYASVTTGMAKTRDARPNNYVLARPWRRGRPKRRILAAGNHAHGDRDEARAAGDAGGA